MYAEPQSFMQFLNQSAQKQAKSDEDTVAPGLQQLYNSNIQLFIGQL